ncbi:MAG: FtsX-like permease family protein [Verrucomicrobiota bacterium]
MRGLALVLRELRHRPVNAALSALGLGAGVALMVVVHLLATSAERETRRVVRDMGFNLRIIPRDTDIGRFHELGHSEGTLAEDAATRLAAGAGTFVSFNHLTPTLERWTNVLGRDALVTGLGAAITGPGERKAPMGFTVGAGRAYLGAAVARRLGLKPGGSLEVAGRTLQVEKVLAEAGNVDDVRVYTSLADAQAILGLPGRISEIRAIDCLCLTSDRDPLGQLREALGRILPEAQVLQLRAIADARARQRQSAEGFAALATPLTLVVAGAWTGVLAFLNVRERRAEIGLWRALGSGSGRVLLLFLGRAVVIGLAGAALGGAAGTWAGLHFGPTLYPVTSAALAPDWAWLARLAWMTPAFAALASLVPAAMAVAQDPSETLRAD